LYPMVSTMVWTRQTRENSFGLNGLAQPLIIEWE
jgi:hypothetical protein